MFYRTEPSLKLSGVFYLWDVFLDEMKGQKCSEWRLKFDDVACFEKKIVLKFQTNFLGQNWSFYEIIIILFIGAVDKWNLNHSFSLLDQNHSFSHSQLKQKNYDCLKKRIVVRQFIF